MAAEPSKDQPQELQRGLGTLQATALNVANMVGIGPFITIGPFLAKMGGPQALVAWVIAALVVLCDGLVWSELGAALPGSGGSYHFLSQIYGRYRWGRILPFLFIWQFLATGTLEMASGYIGAVDYLQYALPNLDQTLEAWHIPGGRGAMAAVGAVVVTLSLCRGIRSLGWLGVALCTGTIATVSVVLVSGVANFRPELLTFPENAFRLDRAFFLGMGGAMTIAVYDYLGYYNVCHLGEEVVNPGKTIPRAVMISVVLVAAIYLTMNVAIIGVVPWQQAMASKQVASEFMETLFGRGIAVAFTGLILWTVVACMFAIMLGYSRIPYAAARQGDFFRLFGRVHEVHKYPVASLLFLGALTAGFCFFPLPLVIDAAVIVRVPLQFISQIVALHILRTTRPDVPMPFRMRLYPIPSVVALIGWVFLVATADLPILLFALGVWISGALAWIVWQLVIVCRDREAFDELISGRQRGLVASIHRALLGVLSPFYRLGLATRNRAYDLGWKTTQATTLPVISIGNVTTGGTGKTPFAAYVARWFRDRDLRVCFLSRGYKAHAGGLNDEALVLEQLCPDVPHLQHPDRVASARIAHEELESELVILDDGFQHRRLGRDVDIVLIDATNPWGYGHLLPRGLLREPVSALRRAELVVITRADQVSEADVAAIRKQVSNVHPAVSIVEVAFPQETLLNAGGEHVPLESLRAQRVAVFCGLGNPQSFEASLSPLGYSVVATKRFPDHHAYSRDDVAELERWAAGLDVAAILTTQKDLVKIPLQSLGGRPLWAVQIGTRVLNGEKGFVDILEAVAKKSRSDFGEA